MCIITNFTKEFAKGNRRKTAKIIKQSNLYFQMAV